MRGPWYQFVLASQLQDYVFCGFCFLLNFREGGENAGACAGTKTLTPRLGSVTKDFNAPNLQSCQ